MTARPTTAPDRSTSAGRGYSTSFTVPQSPAEVFAAVLDVGAWWTGEIDGRTCELGDEFDYRHRPQHFSRQRVVGLEPARRVVWLVTDSELAFVSEPAEWTGSEIVFEIGPDGSGAGLRFTHVGLVPDVECYGACSVAWQHYVDGSLRSLISTGSGLPDPL